MFQVVTRRSLLVALEHSRSRHACVSRSHTRYAPRTHSIPLSMIVDQISLPASLPRRLSSFGIDMEQLLRRAGLPASLFSRGVVTLTTRQFFDLWVALEASGVDRDFGLRIGVQPPPDQYDIASMVALHSRDGAEAIGKLARYKRLVCPEEILIEAVANEVHVEFKWLLAGGPAPTFLTDAAFSSTVLLISRGIGTTVKPLRLELCRSAVNADLLVSHFECHITFDAPRDLLVLSPALLSEPFKTHNLELLELMVPALEAALTARVSELPWVQEVRQAVGRNMRGRRPSVQDIASELLVSTRTLQRRLEEAGTSYQQVLDDVRQDTARWLLATDMHPAEIAFLLGFEELNSFKRAFSDWEGMTPNRWRATRIAQ